MIEGPGHMAINEIEANMQLEKRLCKGAPFYVLGPLVIDIGIILVVLLEELWLQLAVLICCAM
ncbi:hypothetical protein B11447_05190 [Campylobacter jejuni]|nr:hypothetical protein B11447_05190 [Campylobacter jejuni]